MEWLPAIGAGLQIFGSISGGNDKADAYNAEAEAAQRAAAYNASVSTQNAAIAKDEASIAKDQGDEQLAQFGRMAAQVQGTAVASYGASGVVSSEGSPLEILAQSAGQAAYDANMIRYKTDLRVRSNLMKATQFEQDAAFGLQSGENRAASLRDASDDAEMSGWINAGSTLFGAATKYGWLGGSSGGSSGGGLGSGITPGSTGLGLSQLRGGTGISGSLKW